jgi:hypothetical protein
MQETPKFDAPTPSQQSATVTNHKLATLTRREY